MAEVYEIGIYQVEVEKEQGNTYCVRAHWKTQESAQPYQGDYRMEITGIAGTLSCINTSKKHGEITGAALDPQTEYILKVSVGSVSDEMPLLCHTYENAEGFYDGSVLHLSWNAPASDIGCGKCVVDLSNGGSFSYDIPLYVLGMEIPMKEELYGRNIVLAVSLKPYASQFSSGPVVRLAPLYSSRYTVKQNTDGTMRICYKNDSPDETKVTVELEGEIYASEKPDAPVVKSVFELGITEPYTLTIRTDTVLSRKDYDDFIASVCDIVTPKAMYEILEAVTRCASHSVEDSLYFHCGFRPAAAEQENANQRCADVRPGFFLRLEQEMYMPEEVSGRSDTAGFVGTHTAEYMVSLTQGDSMQYLEFDSFISMMDEEIYPPREQAGVKPMAGGIIDLCSVRMRAPFYRIQYPDGVFSSEALPDAYAENHTRLIAAAGWNYIPPSKAGAVDTGAACLWFRGRSAISLLISVVVNGTERKVPVGTTLEKLLSSAGIRGNDVRWYRRSPFGREVRIYFEGKLLKEMMLLNGDRIEA